MKQNLFLLTGLFALMFLTSMALDIPTEVKCSNDNLGLSGLIFPPGTTFLETDESVRFTLPAGYSFVGNSNASGAAVSATNGSVTCKCTASSGACKPFRAGSQVGCTTDEKDPCSKCEMEVKARIGSTDIELADYFIKTPDNNTTGLAYLADNRPILTIEEWNNTPFITRAEVQSSSVSTALDEALAAAWGNRSVQDPAVQKVTVPYLVGGKKVIMVVPLDAVDAGMMYGPAVLWAMGIGVVVKERCTGCSGDCVLKSEKLGQIRYCDGCRSGCTLHW